MFTTMFDMPCTLANIYGTFDAQTGKVTFETPQYYDTGNYIYGFTKGSMTGAAVPGAIVFDANVGELTHNESNYCIIDGAYAAVGNFLGGFEYYYGMTAKRVGQ